jgi:hypothetical protein
MADIVFWFVVVIGVFAFSPAGLSHELVSSRHDLAMALEGAVKCMPDAIANFDGSRFDGGPNDGKRELELLGVRVSNESRHGGEVDYQFPRGIRVFGYEVDSALYFDQSATLFFVRLRRGLGDVQSINNVLRLSPVRKEDQDSYGYFGEIDVRYIRKLNNRDNSFPDVIFSATERKNGQGYVVVGCQNLAW